MNCFGRLLGVIAVALIAGCGGGGGSESPPPEPAAVARVEIRQTGLLLTAAGESRQLEAIATDAQGQTVDAAFTWQSSNPGAVAVDASGRVTAASAAGSAQITAQAGGVSSAPLLVAVARPAAQAQLLTDEQIIGDPVESDPAAVPSLDNTYRVVLEGVAAPRVGQLVVNTGSKAVGGEVVAVATAGGRHTVTLKLVPARVLLPGLALDERLDLSRAPVSFPAELAQRYDIARDGNTYTFTPRPGAFGAAAPRPRALAASGTHALPPFTSCETTLTGTGDALPIRLGLPPLFGVTIEPALDVRYTAANGLERFVLQAEPVISVEGGLNVTAAFEGKIECKLELFVVRVPVGGVLSLIVGGLVSVGAGVEAGGKVTVATMGLSSKVQAKARAELGFACPSGGDCEFVRGLSDTRLEYKPTLDLPSLGDLRVEPTLMAFGFVDLQIGNPFLRSLRFEAVKTRAGGKLAGSFAPMTGQIADAAYQSGYKVSLEASAGVGADLDGALALLGLSNISALELTISTDLAKSPAGTVGVDRATFRSGDTVNFSVRIDPASKDFFPGIGPYNVARVLLVRQRAGELTPSIVGSAEASAGQTEFAIAFGAPDSGTAEEFSAFVVTALLPAQIFALEIGKPAPVLVHEISNDYTCVDDPSECNWVRGVLTLVAYTEAVPGVPQPVPGLEVELTVTDGAACIGAAGDGPTDSQGRFTLRLWPVAMTEACGQSGGAVRLRLRDSQGSVVYQSEWHATLGDT